MKNKLIKANKLLAVLLLVILLLSSCNTNKPYDNLINKAIDEGYAVVQFLDVGQADCSLISLPDGRQILIDAGNQEDGQKIVNHLLDLGIKKLDYIICSHPHEDHIGGMTDVISRFDVGKIIMPKIADEDVDGSGIYETLLLAVLDIDKSVMTATPGKIISNDDGLSIECLAPCFTSYGNMNDYSAVVMITYGKTEILFTGDAERLSETDMLSLYGDSLDADILKVGHHGSNTATSDEFLAAVDPEYAVISCGKNNQYGHPHDEVIDRLEEHGCEILRTDNSGSIIFYLDSEGIANYITTQKICLNGE